MQEKQILPVICSLRAVVMKHISILVPNESVLGSIENARRFFIEVNGFFISAGRPPLFKVQLVAPKPEVGLHKGSFTVHIDILLTEVKKTDLVIIPAIYGDIAQAVELNKHFIPWIADMFIGGAELAGLGTGNFLLASTSLLNGNKCAIHWTNTELFRNMFPEVNIADDKVITDENGIYTSGGGQSYLNLLLYLVERFAGYEMAILASRVFSMEMGQASQPPFLLFRGQKEHEDEPVIKAQEFIENNFQEKITIEQLAGLFSLSRRSLERRFKKATRNTVTEYIRRVKIEAAKKGIETTRKNIYEIMYEVGYSDVKAFRSIFRKLTGFSPAQYRSRHNSRISVNRES